MTIRAQRWTNRGALLLGVVLAAGFVVAGSVPAGERPLRLHANVTAAATGGVAVAPVGPVLRARGLVPGRHSATRRVTLLNQTSAPVSVVVRAGGPKGDLDRSLQVELRTRGAAPLRSSLARLRRWLPLGGPIDPHRRARISVRVGIPGAVRDGYEGRQANVTLEFSRRGIER